ncbi:MAG: amidohydrolase [Flavobacteriales bacterium]
MDFTAARKELHRHPEVSNEEFATSRRIRAWLNELGHPDAVVELDQTGFAAVYRGAEPGPRIALRCELDALPISEVNTFEHRSLTPNVSHKCGHDGHMTVLLEVAQFVANHRPIAGEVVLLFQSAEETGDGAIRAVHHADFSKVAPDFVYALHNIPGVAKRTVLIRDGAFTPGVRSLIFRIFGKTSHAAEPEKGLNPALAMSDCIRLAEAMTVADASRDDFFLITTIHMTMGEKAYGISAGYGEVHVTLRAWDELHLQSASQMYCDECVSSIQKKGFIVETEWCYEFEANLNHPEAAQRVREATKTLELPVQEMAEPFRFGEDFGVFTQRFKGAMFGFGAGEATPALHNPDYDFPDDIRPDAAKLFIELLKSHLEFQD